jgi:hypothetical protein
MPTTTTTAPADVTVGSIGYQALKYRIGAGFKAQMTTTSQSSTHPHYNIVFSKDPSMDPCVVNVLQVTSFSKIKGKVAARQKSHAILLRLEGELSQLEPGSAAHKSKSDQIVIQKNKRNSLPATVSDHFGLQYQSYVMAVQGDEWSPGAPTLNPGNTGLRGFVLLDSLTPLTQSVSPYSMISCVISECILTFVFQIEIANVGVLPETQVSAPNSARVAAGLSACKFLGC